MGTDLTRDGVMESDPTDSSASKSPTGSAATAGATRAEAPEEDVSGHITNALHLLCTCRSQDIDLMVSLEPGEPSPAEDIERRLELALKQLANDAIAEKGMRRALVAAMEEIRRLKLALDGARPRPAGIARWVVRDPDSRELIDTFIITLSDGSMRHYHPNRPAGKRFEILEPIPTTRAAILSSGSVQPELVQ